MPQPARTKNIAAETENTRGTARSQPNRRPTVESFLLQLMKELKPADTTRSRNGRTPQPWKGLLNTIPDWLRTIELQDLDVDHCEQYWTSLRPRHLMLVGAEQRPGKKRSEQSAKKYFQAFTRALDQAVKHRLLKANPAREVTFAKPMATNSTPAISRDQVWRIAEVRALLQAFAQSARPAVYVCFCLMALTGLTASEAAALQRRDLDLDYCEPELNHPRPRIHVQRLEDCGKMVRLGRRKDRWVDVSPPLERVLRQWLTRLPDRPQTWLFPCPESSQISRRSLGCLSYRELVSEWKRALKRTSLPQLPLRSVRDTYAVLLLDRGENLVYLSLQLGYRLVTRMEKRYGPWIKRQSHGLLNGIHEELGMQAPVPPPPPPADPEVTER